MFTEYYVVQIITNLRVISITVSFSRSNSCFLPIDSIYSSGNAVAVSVLRLTQKKQINYILEGLRVRIRGGFFVISFCFYVFFFRFMFIGF